MSDPAGEGAPDRLGHLWAGWRTAYIHTVNEDPTPLRPDEFGSLFERILVLPDDEGMVVHRGRTCAVLMNAYPYTNGHVLVLPQRAVADLADLTGAEQAELWQLVADAVAAVRSAFRADGVNVGLNLGAAAGAGVPDHLHVHVLPRWDGDTNFMTAVAEARVLPETLSSSWQRLRDAWPDA